MKEIIMTTLLAAMASMSYGQLHFVIDNKNPCSGQSITFSLPPVTGCSNIRVASQGDWKISPAPAAQEVRYNFSSQNGVNGYTSVTLTYVTYHPTISVLATFACNGKPSGTVTDIVNMVPPLTGNPAVSGLDATIYSGDQSTARASLANTLSYSWKLSIVQTISGTITQSAIVNPSSQQTIVNWPADFVGIVDIVATAIGCSGTKQFTKRVIVLAPPSAVFYESSVANPAHCAGTSLRYRLEVFGGFSISQTQVITSAGATDITVFNTKNGVPVEWTVRWVRDGDIRIRYSVTNGNRTWAGKVTSSLTFDILEFDAGQIHPLPITPYCAPTNVMLSLDRQPVGSPYTFQYCSSNDCSVASSDWVDNNPSTSATFIGLSTNTSFRVKLTDNRCGTFQSAPLNISVRPTPTIAVSDQAFFSAGTFNIPSSNLPFSTIAVKATSLGITGASDTSVLQGSTMGSLASQTLGIVGPSDGTVVYSITPSKDGCTGQTKKATVVVYRKPVIQTDRKYIYKGLIATLTTGDYDSYQWQTGDGKTVGSDSACQAASPNKYIVTVTKNGARGTSDPLMIGGQFSDVNENFVLTRVPSSEFTSTTILESLTEQDVMESIQYFDGLGRPLQNISIRTSPSGHDVVQPFAYDQYGRSARRFLPYVSSEDNGRIRHKAIENEQLSFYQGNETSIASDTEPYAETVFENSPLNRVLKQGSPGHAWQPNISHPELEHVVRHQYLLNTAEDSVMRFGYDYENETITCSPGPDAYYSPGTLFKNVTLDEDNKDAIEFADKLDRTVCRKVTVANKTSAYTYYVFDDFGNLVVVVSPEGSKAIMKR
jgi:hypothetical protein